MKKTFENVKICFTGNMSRKNDFEKFSYTAVLPKTEYINAVRTALSSWKKTKNWEFDDTKILKLSCAKTKDDLSYDLLKNGMNDDEIALNIDCDEPIKATTGDKSIGFLSIASIIVDLYGTEYNKRKFICHKAPKGVVGSTVKVIKNTAQDQVFVGFEDEQTAENDESMDAPF